MSKIDAPMSSTVVSVLVARDQAVRAGQVLLIIEAMKMEHEIRATTAGEVLAVLVTAGATVAKGELLVELSPGTARGRGAARLPQGARGGSRRR